MMAMLDVVRSVADTATSSYCVLCGTHYPTYQGHVCTMTIDIDQLCKDIEDGKAPDSVCEKTLKTALELTGGDRAKQHGDKRQNHQNIADLWNAYLGGSRKVSDDIAVGVLARPLTAHDVAIMMILVKVARTKSGTFNLDNFIDIAGYAGVAAECADAK